MARRKPKTADEIPAGPRCYCGHPEARHWSGAGGYSRMCLHHQVTGELCLCLDYGEDTTAAAA